MNIFGILALITIPITIITDILKDNKASMKELVVYKVLVMLYIIDKLLGW